MQLPVEILDTVFAQFLRRWEYSLTPLPEISNLRCASLVCRDWREPAQRALQAFVVLKAPASVQRYKEAFIGDGAYFQAKNVRCISLIGFSVGETCRHFETMQSGLTHLRELHIQLARYVPDEEMAAFLRQLPSLRILVISERTDNPEIYGYKYKDMTACVAQIAFGLPQLQHLWLEGLRASKLPLGELDEAVSPPFLQVAIMYCDIAPGILHQLVRRSSTRLYMAYPDKPPIDLLTEAFDTIGPRLESLALFHGTREDCGDPLGSEAFPTPGDILVPLCPNLRLLCIQDVDLSPSSLAGLASLRTLLALTGDQERFLAELMDLRLADLRTVILRSEVQTTEENESLNARHAGAETCLDVQFGSMLVQSRYAVGLFRGLLPPCIR